MEAPHRKGTPTEAPQRQAHEATEDDMQAHHQHEAQVTSSPPNAELKIKAGNSDDRKKQSSELTLALALALALALTLALALALVVVVDVVVVVMMVVVVMVGIAESEMETESVSNRFQIAQKASNATPTQRDNNRRMIPSNDQAHDTTRQASTQTHALNRAKESRRDGDGQKRISTVIDC